MESTDSDDSDAVQEFTKSFMANYQGTAQHADSESCDKATRGTRIQSSNSLKGKVKSKALSDNKTQRKRPVNDSGSPTVTLTSDEYNPSRNSKQKKQPTVKQSGVFDDTESDSASEGSNSGIDDDSLDESSAQDAESGSEIESDSNDELDSDTNLETQRKKTESCAEAPAEVDSFRSSSVGEMDDSSPLAEEDDSLEEPDGQESEAESAEGNQSDSGTSDVESHLDPKTSAEKSTEDDLTALRKELADLPFEDLQKLKQKIGIKAYNQAMFGTDDRNPRKRQFKRDNKNRPMEMSSKRPVSVYREVAAVKKKTFRDPRFDDLSGEYNENLFTTAYSFLKDVKQFEKQKLLKQLKKEKDTEKKAQLEQLITRMTHQEREERKKQEQQRKEQEIRRKERSLIMEGKQAFYLKKGDKKKLELAEKYKELKKSGKVDSYLAKKKKVPTATLR